MAMAYQQIAEAFWRDGYLHLPNFFTAALMDDMDAVVTDHFGLMPAFSHTDEFRKEAQVEVIPWFPQMETGRHPLFDQVDGLTELADLTAAILGAGWQNLYSMVMFSRKGTAGQAWHQDCAPEKPAHFNLNRLIYSRGILPEIGGEVVVMPGSHRLGLVPAGIPHEDMCGQVVLRPGQGDLLLLHGHCWHRVLPIRDKYRYSINYRSSSAATPKDITDICVYRNMRYRFSTSEIVEVRS